MKRLILERKRDSMDYAMRVYPMHLENGKTEWCVEYPDLKGCVGGGDTIEEISKKGAFEFSDFNSFLKRTLIFVSVQSTISNNRET